MSDEQDIDLGQGSLSRPHPEFKNAAFFSDPTFYHKVANYLGWCLLACVVGAAVSYVLQNDVPQILTAVASGIVGVFAGVMGVSK